jgi:predicted nuclease of predicted toxin-antitoxin system
VRGVRSGDTARRESLPAERVRLLADENVPLVVINVLRADGHDVLAIREVAAGTDDESVLLLAVKENRILVTLDKDLGELAVRTDCGPKAGVVLVRLKPGPNRVAQILRDVVLNGQCGPARLVVVDEGRIRVRELGGK